MLTSIGCHIGFPTLFGGLGAVGQAVQAAITLIEDNLDQDPPTLDVEVVGSGTATLDFYSTAIAPAVGAGDLLTQQITLSPGAQNILIDLSALVGVTGRIRITLGNTSITTQEFTTTGVNITARLLETDWTTSRENNMDGMYWNRPYDLTQMGTLGNNIATAKGERYVWFVSSDHYRGDFGAAFGGGVWMGFNSDPGTMPSNFVQIFKPILATGDPGVNGDHAQVETPRLVYNPDDPTSPFYMYLHGNAISDAVRGQETLLYKSSDLEAWTFVAVSHVSEGDGDHTGYQHVFRNGTGDWESFGLKIDNNPGFGGGRWTSTDGVTFTFDQGQSGAIFSRNFSRFGGADPITANGERLAVSREFTPGEGAGALVPLDAVGAISASAESEITRFTQVYDQVLGTPSHVQATSNLLEDGVSHTYLRRGYFETSTEPDDYTDYYSIIYDVAAAATAAPSGLRASCAAGVVTLDVYDALPHQDYRIEVSTTSKTTGFSQVSDETGLQFTHTPPGTGMHWYRVSSRSGATIGASRTVPIFVGPGSAFVNKHITRIAEDGFDVSTVNQTQLQATYDFLSTNNLLDHVENWVDPAFGCKFSSGVIIDRIADIGATLRPHRVSDTRIDDAVMSFVVDAFGTGLSGTSGSSRMYLNDGQINPLRYLTEVTAGAAWRPVASAGTWPLVYRNTNGFWVQHSRSTETVNFTLRDSASDIYSTSVATNVDPLIAAFMSVDDTNLVGYVNGSASAPVAAPNRDILLGEFHPQDRDTVVLAGGVDAMKFRPGGGVYIEGALRNSADFACQFVFNSGLTTAQAAALDTFLQARMGN